jgi:rubrerythrin
MSTPRPIRTVTELYAHAIALEKEAAERYREFAQRMADEGNDEVASLFSQIASAEEEHLDTLLRRTEGCSLPPLPLAKYRWLDAGAPETAARELVYRLMTPRQALAIALAAEKRARDFFDEVRRSAADPGVRALAQEMSMEENEHIGRVLEVMARMPAGPDWEKVFEQNDQ